MTKIAHRAWGGQLDWSKALYVTEMKLVFTQTRLHYKCPFNTQERSGRGGKGKKTCRKQTETGDINLTLSAITLRGGGLNAPLEQQGSAE